MDKQYPRKVPMGVLSLGMPRTSTASMQAALRILGYNDTHHGFMIVDEPETAAIWEEAADSKFSSAGPALDRAFFDRALSRFASTTDMPCAFFAQELVEAYPEAKIVLVERDINSWYNSFQPLMEGIYGIKGAIMVYTTEPILCQHPIRTLRKLYTGYMGGSTATEALGNAKKRYHEHYEFVRGIVPSDKLLNYELGTGWEPLCDFLGKEVPAVDFPHLNESKALQEKMKTTTIDRVGKAAQKVFIPLFPVGLILWLIFS
ncbi:hypothetical protein BDV97DRAFT_342480 [Delphinella strobiligena]|nr:hypothetical protein BDV97DRAFT_342480 [Delphinella strobiligena]